MTISLFGVYYDEESGLYYLRARYYDPNVRRFISEDPVEDGGNWYVYAGNNPVMFIDPSGLRYIPLRETAESYGFKVYYDPETKTATLSTGVEFFPGDGKGTFIDSTNGKMYVWQEGDDSSIFFLPGNDTVSDEGWIITAAAVTIVIGVKAAPKISKLARGWFGKSASIASAATMGAQRALENIDNYVVKSKHLPRTGGDWAKFSTSNTTQIKSWIATALKNSKTFIVNSEDSFYTIYEIGQQIGTKGEQAIKVVFTKTGKIITAFPVK